MKWPADDDGIVDMILGNEGKTFTNWANDPGGPTKFGIDLETLRTWRKDETLQAAAVQALDESEARRIYTTRYISGPGFNQIADIKLRAFVCDTAVLWGPVHATRMLQGAADLPQDAELTPAVAKVVNEKEARHLINAIAVERIVEHAMETAQKPNKLVFLRGWVNRAAKAIS